MQIMVIGKTYGAKKIAEFFAKNKENIVFSTQDAKDCINTGLNSSNTTEIQDFAAANGTGLVVATEPAVNYGDITLPILAPDVDTSKLCLSISSGKKFAYKNRIQTSRFAVFEKAAAALEYLQAAEFPVIIAPDCPNEYEIPLIFETREKAKARADYLFQTGNKRIIIEKYIHGIEYTKYFISDKMGVLPLLETVSYFNEISTNNTNYIPKNARIKIENEITPKLLDAFMEEGLEFSGIMGVSFVIDKNCNIYFTCFRPFLSELDIEILLNTMDEDFENVLKNCANGKLTENFKEIAKNDKYVISMNQNGEIYCSAANTMAQAIKLFEYDEIDTNIVKEAIKHWKM